MPDIFLSYNREDQPRAKVFAEAFEREGLKVWWDVGLTPGEAYDEVTEAALRTAKAVVVLWSPRSVVSRWVRAEATLADRNKTLVPCMIEACERPIMFELTQTAELAHWQGDAADKAWLAFLAGVRRFVTKDAAPTVETPAASVTAPSVQETLKPGQSGSAPSIAVLPFTNRSSLPEDEVFAEGMVEDVISALSQGVNVRVLGSMTTANLRKGAIADPAAVGRQLGVRYLLEGNVRRVGANLRVTTQLLEAATGAVSWVAKFERPLTQMAELQEDLVLEVAANLGARVYGLELERALRKPSDITAWEATIRAFGAAFRQADANGLALGIEEATRAIAIAPDYGLPHALLAEIQAARYMLGHPDEPSEVAHILAIAERGLSLAPDDPSVLSYYGTTLCYLGSPREALRFTANAVARIPGDGIAQNHHGIVCAFLGDTENALTHLDLAKRLMPGMFLVWAPRWFQALALIGAQRWSEASEAMEACVDQNPQQPHCRAHRAILAAREGRSEAALADIQVAQKSGLAIDQFELSLRRLFYANRRVADELAHGLRSLWVQSEFDS